MHGKDDQWQRELTENLKRAGQQLALGVAEEAADSFTRVRSHLEERRTKRRLKEEAEQAKRDAKQAKREARMRKREAKQRKFKSEPEASRPVAWVFALFSLIMASVAFINLDTMWWMFFVAFGFAVHSATLFGKLAQAEPLPSGEGGGVELPEGGGRSEVQREAQLDPLGRRLDEACDKLESALSQAPAHVREFLSSEPEQTVKELRATCRDLLRRERSLRTLVSPEETQRLEREREALNERITRSNDDVVRGRLYQALAALQHQQAQQKQLAQSADRLEAERMRLGYTLEGLHAQVMRLQFADVGALADPAGAGLRISLEQLRDELGALAEAAEEVNRLQSEPGAAMPKLAELEAPADSSEGSKKQRTR